MNGKTSYKLETHTKNTEKQMSEYMTVSGRKKNLPIQKFPGGSPQACLKIGHLINRLWNIKRQENLPFPIHSSDRQ